MASSGISLAVSQANILTHAAYYDDTIKIARFESNLKEPYQLQSGILTTKIFDNLLTIIDNYDNNYPNGNICVETHTLE